MYLYSGGLNIQCSQLGHRAQGLNLKGLSISKKQNLPRIKRPQAKYSSQKKDYKEPGEREKYIYHWAYVYFGCQGYKNEARIMSNQADCDAAKN